jgi:hypothetical protein
VVSDSLRRLSPPWIYIVLYVGFFVMMSGFVMLWTFLAAQPITEFDLQGKTLSVPWKLAVHDHGRYFEGYAIAENPLRFAAALVVFVAGWGVMLLSQRAIRQQIELEGETRKGKDKWMRILGLAVSFMLMLLAMKFVFVGTYPS